MSDPSRVLLWMLLFLVAVLLVASGLMEPLREAFLANRVFNGMIIGVLLIGMLVNLRQVLILRPEFRWIKAFSKGEEVRRQPRLLAPMVKLLAGRDREFFRISAMAMRAMLDGIRLRLDESRDLSRYLSGLLVFLGLLGTFWGLLDTVSGVVEVISGLGHQGGDLTKNFTELTQKLQIPLAGMGTAFSSSLFGLSGALIVGFMDLQASHAQNRFYNDLEEWLSDLAHLPNGSINVEGEMGVPSYIEALLEQTADSLNNLQRSISRSEEGRLEAQRRQLELAERLAELADQLRAEQKMMVNLAKNQQDLYPLLNQLATQVGQQQSGGEAMNQHLRNVDVGINRLLDELSKDRSQFSKDVRDEVRLLARTLARKESN